MAGRTDCSSLAACRHVNWPLWILESSPVKIDILPPLWGCFQCSLWSFHHSCIRHTGCSHLWKTYHSLNSRHPGPSITVTPVCSGLAVPSHTFVPGSDLKILHNSLSPNSFSQQQETSAAQERPKHFLTFQFKIVGWFGFCFFFTLRYKSHWNNDVINSDFSQTILRQAQEGCTLHKPSGQFTWNLTRMMSLGVTQCSSPAFKPNKPWCLPTLQSPGQKQHCWAFESSIYHLWSWVNHFKSSAPQL